MKGAWVFGEEPPPFKMLIGAISTEGNGQASLYSWFYFIGYYAPEDRIFIDPCSRTIYCSKVVDAWRIFDHTLEQISIEFERDTAGKPEPDNGLGHSVNQK